MDDCDLPKVSWLDHDGIPYVAKYSQSIIFANFANGASSRILLLSRTLCSHIHGIFEYALTTDDVTLRWRTSMEALFGEALLWMKSMGS